jgi:serine/threonine protein kinase/Tol biopolymer transport system component
VKDTLPTRVRVGVFELNLKAGELREGNRSILLQEQPFRILVMLLEHPGEIVARERIKKNLWPNDTIVEFDHSINAAIKNLRRALGDSADEPKFIETVARRGYRLMVPVEWIAVAEDSPGEVVDRAVDGAGAAELSQAAAVVLIGKTVSHYRVLDIIGGGGMGVVYRAEDLKLGRRVALKFLPEETATDSLTLQRFEREAQSASSLNHPNICTIYEFGEHEGQPFLVMELLQGETLRERLAVAAGETGLKLDELLDIALQVTDGLQAANEQGIIHRDIKPANIFLTNNGVCKILDFGLAKLLELSEPETEQQLIPGGPERVIAVDATLTRAGFAIGTAGYMSPEQVRGEKLDARADLFSFGLVLYEMATGRRAFSGETTPIVHDAVLHQPHVPVRYLNSKVPPRLERIIDKALEKDRDQRWQSAAEMRADLEMVQGSKQTVARRRFWWAALAAALAVAAGAAYLGLRRPLPPPRITATTQLTIESSDNDAPLLTDGTRLFFNLALEPRQMSVKGGLSSPLRLPFPNPTAEHWYKPGDGVLEGISPDRTEFLISRVYEEKGHGYHELWVAPIAGGYPRRLGNILAKVISVLRINQVPPTPYRTGMSDPHLSATVWSPDGQLLVYPSAKELYLARANGTEIRKLATFDGYPNFVRWSPDGRSLRLSVSTEKDYESSLWELTIADGRVRPLLPGWDPSWYTCCGNWTSDGRYYVFQSRGNLWAMREKTGFFQHASNEPVQLTAGLMKWYWPLPSVDGKRLFAEGYEQRNEFLRYDLQSGRFAPELPGVSGTDLEFSKDGKWVTYVSVPEGLLFRAAADGSQRRQLTWAPLRAAGPRWSPDGKQIAFAGAPPGTPTRIYVVSSDGGEPRQVSNGEAGGGKGDGDSEPSWSPDGASLAFGGGYVAPVAKKSIVVVDFNTKQVSALPGSQGMWFPCWSPDGRFIAGLFGAGPRMLPTLYDLKTQKQTQLSDLASAYPDWSWDGEFLFFQSDGWVWRLRMRNRKVERVVNLNDIRVAGYGWFAAAPSNSFVTAHNAGGQQIFALDWEAP